MVLAVLVFLAGLISAIISRQLADEFKAWIPWIIEHLIRCATERLPEDERDRYAEEWRGHIDEIPGEIGKIICALGFLSAARRIALLSEHIATVAKNISDDSRRRHEFLGKYSVVIDIAKLLFRPPFNSFKTLLDTLDYLDGNWMYEEIEYELFDDALGDNTENILKIRLPKNIPTMPANALLEFTWRAIALNIIKRHPIEIREANDTESETVMFYDLTAAGRHLVQVLKTMEKVRSALGRSTRSLMLWISP